MWARRGGGGPRKRKRGSRVGVVGKWGLRVAEESVRGGWRLVALVWCGGGQHVSVPCCSKVAASSHAARGAAITTGECVRSGSLAFHRIRRVLEADGSGLLRAVLTCSTGGYWIK
jgi:hypothetical protein